jgi:hypothetical protein
MRKLLIGMLTIGLFGLGPTSPSRANQVVPYQMCATPESPSCIVSFEIKGPGLSDFTSLSGPTYRDDGAIFSALNSTYAPSTGVREFRLLVRENTFASMNPTAPKGAVLAQIEISDSVRNLASQLPLDSETTFRVKVNGTAVFPGPAIAFLDKGIYGFGTVGSVYQFTLESKPLDIFSVSNSIGCAFCPSPVAAEDKRGKFSVIFMPPEFLHNSTLSGFGPYIYPWFAIESNAESASAPTWSSGLNIRVSSPHLRSDGVTLNQGKYRLVLNESILNSSFQMSREQAISGALIAQSAEIGSAMVPVSSAVTAIDSNFIEMNLASFHYSTRDIAVKPSVSLKSSSVTWSGKKSSVKRNKALTVKSSVKSNKKKATGTMRVDLVNASGVVVGSISSKVKKGSGKVTFSKTFTKSLAPGRYTVKINFFGSGTAKNSNRSYSLKVK